MADDGSPQAKAVWPLVRFQFSVSLDGSLDILFQEVTGLTHENTPIEYRAAGKGQPYSVIKMPGIVKYGNITLKKGQFTGDRQLWDKYTAVKMNTLVRIPIIISLLDEAGEPVMSWTLRNAFVCKMVFSDMKSDDDEPAIEEAELAHEGLMLTLPS